VCGVVGIVDKGGVSIRLYYALYALQHRGRNSTRMSTFDGNYLHSSRGYGLVADVYSPDKLFDLKGSIGVGNVRYPKFDGDTVENIEPLNFHFKKNIFSIVHDGNLVDWRELRTEYEKTGVVLSTTSDTEIISKILIEKISNSKSIEDAIRSTMQKLNGSYSIVMMINGILYAFRDPLGIKPLCISKTENGYMVASESVAADGLNAKFLRDVKPGELIRIDTEGIRSTQIAVAERHAHCIFEFLYFCRIDSILEGLSLYSLRLNIGKKLFDKEQIKADIVSPVPNGGTALALGYSDQSQIPYCEGIMLNRYVDGVHLAPSLKIRAQILRAKFNPIPAHIKNKVVILVDDSILGGTNSSYIIKMMRDAGASEIHLRIGSPAIKAPCYLGVDLRSREKLLASKMDEKKVCRKMGATTLRYISLETLIDAIKMHRDDFCVGCITGCYPVKIDGEISQLRKINFIDNTKQETIV